MLSKATSRSNTLALELKVKANRRAHLKKNSYASTKRNRKIIMQQAMIINTTHL